MFTKEEKLAIEYSELQQKVAREFSGPHTSKPENLDLLHELHAKLDEIVELHNSTELTPEEELAKVRDVGTST